MPIDIVVGNKSLSWGKKTMQEAEGHTSPQGTSRESKRPKIFLSYLSTMSHIINYEPSYHGEVTCEHVWKDSMKE
jgi:hypothetical protein